MGKLSMLPKKRFRYYREAAPLGDVVVMLGQLLSDTDCFVGLARTFNELADLGKDARSLNLFRCGVDREVVCLFCCFFEFGDPREDVLEIGEGLGEVESGFCFCCCRCPSDCHGFDVNFLADRVGKPVLYLLPKSMQPGAIQGVSEVVGEVGFIVMFTLL